MSPLNERDPRQSDSLLNNDYEANNNNLMRSPTEDGTENDYNTLNSFPSIMDIYPTNNTSKFVLYIRTNLLISTIFWLWALYNTFFTSYSNIGESFDLGTVSFLAVMGSCRGILRELGVGVWRQNSGSGEEVGGEKNNNNEPPPSLPPPRLPSIPTSLKLSHLTSCNFVAVNYLLGALSPKNDAYMYYCVAFAVGWWVNAAVGMGWMQGCL